MKRIVWLFFAALFSLILTADSYYVSDVWPKNRFANTSPVPIISTYSPSNNNYNQSYGAALIDRMRSYKYQQTVLHDYQSQTYNDLNESCAYEQTYTLSDVTKTHLKKQGFSKKIWTKSLYGTKQQQQLHTSFILLTEKAVLKTYSQSHAHDLYQSVIDHAAAGCLATRANNIDLAYSLHTFCIALFDCAELVTSAVLSGTKNVITPILHPIQTTKEIISDIELIAECTVNLINRAIELASVRTKDEFEL